VRTMLGRSLEEQSVVPNVLTRKYGYEFPAVARHLGNHFGWCCTHAILSYAKLIVSGQTPEIHRQANRLPVDNVPSSDKLCLSIRMNG
jgi:hypothetical protein